MEVHVTPDDLQIIQVCRSIGYKAITARVTIEGSEPKKSIAARGEVG